MAKSKIVNTVTTSVELSLTPEESYILYMILNNVVPNCKEAMCILDSLRQTCGYIFSRDYDFTLLKVDSLGITFFENYLCKLNEKFYNNK